MDRPPRHSDYSSLTGLSPTALMQIFLSSPKVGENTASTGEQQGKIKFDNLKQLFLLVKTSGLDTVLQSCNDETNDVKVLFNAESFKTIKNILGVLKCHLADSSSQEITSIENLQGVMTTECLGGDKPHLVGWKIHSSAGTTELRISEQSGDKTVTVKMQGNELIHIYCLNEQL